MMPQGTEKKTRIKDRRDLWDILTRSWSRDGKLYLMLYASSPVHIYIYVYFHFRLIFLLIHTYFTFPMTHRRRFVASAEIIPSQFMSPEEQEEDRPSAGMAGEVSDWLPHIKLAEQV